MQVPQYACVQKPPSNQQPDQFLARIQQSTHCRNCKCVQNNCSVNVSLSKNIIILFTPNHLLYI